MARASERRKFLKRFEDARQRVRQQRSQLSRQQQELRAERERLEAIQYRARPRRIGQSRAERERELRDIQAREQNKQAQISRIKETESQISRAINQLNEAETSINQQESQANQQIKQALRSRGLRYVGGTQPTQTEQELGMSLLPQYRDLPAEEVQASQSLYGGQRADVRETSFTYEEPSYNIPPPTVSKAPTLKEQFQESLRGRNPVTGSLFFAGEKTQGAFGRAEQRFSPRGQSLARTGAISTGVQLAPFVIPATAPVSGLAFGIGQFGTSGGRQELRTSSPGKRALLIGGATAGIGLGAFALPRQVSKLAGFPRFESRLLQQPASIEGVTISRIQTTQRGLVSRRQFESVAVAGTKRFPIGGGKEAFRTTVAGRTIEPVKTITRQGELRINIGREQFFTGRVRGISEQKPVTATIKEFRFAGGGSTAQGLDVPTRELAGISRTPQFKLTGGGIQAEQKSIFFGTTRQVEPRAFEGFKTLGQGRGRFIGVQRPAVSKTPAVRGLKGIRQPKRLTTDTLSGRASTEQVLSRLTPQQRLDVGLSSAVVQSDLSRTFSVTTTRAVRGARSTGSLKQFGRARQETKITTSTVPAISQTVSPRQAFSLGTQTRTRTLQTARTESRLRQPQAIVNLQAPRVTERQSVGLAQALSFRQGQRQRQRQTGRFGTTTPNVPIVRTPPPKRFFIPVSAPLPSLKFGKIGASPLGSQQRFADIPSFGAFAFNVKGKRGRRTTGLEFQPLFPGFRRQISRRRKLF